MTDGKLASIAISLSVDKVLGLDGVLTLVLKVTITHGMFKSAIQTCLDEGVFPVVWKWQIVVFSPLVDPSVYTNVLT